MMVIRPDSVPDNLEEQKIYIFTDNYLDNQRFVEPPIYSPLWFVRDLFILNLTAPVFELIINRVPYYITLIIIGGGGTCHFLDISDRRFASLC